jgi:acid phosphatase
LLLTSKQDYSAASGDSDQKYLASQGITLTNYFATTHPSEPNYCAVVSGDNFGMDNDDFNAIPSNISTVVDLLDTKGISWAEYQEDIPYPGFEGFNFSNQATFNNDYVRKHDPLILFESVTLNATRLDLIKNFTAFNDDLQKQQLPQWAFITPNMTDDGHDTNITFASKWERSWLAPLLNNPYFMKNTLILLTFDENESKTKPNKVYSILLGGAVPDSLKGTIDDTFYNHYSTISSVSVNWGLPSLGRWDCNANVFQIVANKTGYVNYEVDTKNLFFNASYPGPLSDDKYIPVWPVPDTTAKCAAGKGVLQAVVSTWSQSTPTYNYTSPYPYDAPNGINAAGSATRPGSSSASSGSSSSASASSPTASGSSTASATSSSASASSSSSAASPFTSISTSLLGFLTGLAAFII